MKPRVLLYCHNVLGFGHIVRSMLIARQLSGEAEVRLITGCRFLDHLRVPEDVGVVMLPALRAEADGRLTPVDGGFLGSALRRRGKLIAQQVREWQPHALLVDHNPFGLMGELVETLDAVRDEGLPTSMVWGIRDIWSSPEYLANMLRQYPGDPDAMKQRIKLYHSAIAYTDGTWLETLERYDAGMLPERTASVGFVTEPVAVPRSLGSSVPRGGPETPRYRGTEEPRNPLVAVLSGGGEGAERLASLVLAGCRASRCGCASSSARSHPRTASVRWRNTTRGSRCGPKGPSRMPSATPRSSSPVPATTLPTRSCSRSCR